MTANIATSLQRSALSPDGSLEKPKWAFFDGIESFWKGPSPFSTELGRFVETFWPAAGKIDVGPAPAAWPPVCGQPRCTAGFLLHS